MNINKEVCTITKTKFQEIKEELDCEYYEINSFTDNRCMTYECRLAALKNAVDELLTLLDKAIS